MRDNHEKVVALIYTKQQVIAAAVIRQHHTTKMHGLNQPLCSLTLIECEPCLYLRWLERVFKCYKPFETRKDYKEVFLSM